MGSYNAVAIGGKFHYAAMPDSISALVRNIFNTDPVIGKQGHWLEDKRICLMRGIHKEDYLRLTDRMICEWEWDGVDSWSLRDGDLKLRNISQTKASVQAFRALFRILGPYAPEGEVFAVLGSNQGDELTLECFWWEDNALRSIPISSDDSFLMKPFLQEHLWFNGKELECLSLI